MSPLIPGCVDVMAKGVMGRKERTATRAGILCALLIVLPLFGVASGCQKHEVDDPSYYKGKDFKGRTEKGKPGARID